MNNCSNSSLKEILFPYHGHSAEGSPQDGCNSAEEIVLEHKMKGYDTVCLTDHGSLASQFKLWKACEKHGLKPQIGIECYLIPFKHKDLKEKTFGDFENRSDDKTFHQTIIALNQTGYENLLKLNYISNLKPMDGINVAGHTGYFRKTPRITEELLFEYQEGLAVSTGCRVSWICEHLQAGNIEKAKELLQLFKRNVQHFFIELHIAHNEVEENLFHWLKDYSFKENIPTLVANDYHYTTKGDLSTWNILGGLRRNLTKSNPDAIKNDDFYIKEVDEVYDRVQELTKNVKETNKIFMGFEVLRNLLTFEWKNRKAPKITFDNSEVELFNKLSNALINKFNGRENIPVSYSKRLREEFEVAKYTGNCSYYLIVEDVVTWARNKGLTTPIGRGSAASLLMLYLLNVTKIDPMLYNLVAERASNRQRKKEMDVDLDFGKEDRVLVLEYIKQKYGKNCVANIANYGMNHLSSSIRGVLRYMEYPEWTKNSISKAIKEKFTEFRYAGDEVDEIEPTIAGIENQPDFISIFKQNNVHNYKEVLSMAKGIENTCNNVSIHASGILISNKPIFEQYPVIRSNDTLASAFSMDDLGDLGALKLDLLSVTNYDKVSEGLAMYNKHVKIREERLKSAK